MDSTKRAGKTIAPALIIAGLIAWLILPATQFVRAHAAGNAGSKQSKSSHAQNIARRAELERLLARFQVGDPFSFEEAEILRRFRAGIAVSDIEADTLISRALHTRTSGNPLTREQEELLSRYTALIANRSHDLLDRKMQLLEERRAAEAAALSGFSVAAAPANDTCAGAEIIPAAGPFPHLTATTADITDATTAGDPPVPSCTVCAPTPCTPQLSRSIWYRFTPSATATYTFSSCADAPTGTTVDDTVMGIYTSTGSCAGPFTEIPAGGLTDGCGDDECGTEPFQAAITTQLTGGTTYYIVVWLYGTAAPLVGDTAVQLRVSQATVPANNTCAGALALTLNTPVAGTTVGAANDYQLSGAACFTALGNTQSTAPGRDVVYSFTAPFAGKYSVRVTNYSALSDLVLYVASSCPVATPGTPVTVSSCIAASNRNTFESAEEVTCTQLTSSQQVFMFVDESGSTDGSAFNIEVTRCAQETEPNNTPATANQFVLGIEGAINPAGEADFYSLDTPANGSRVFALVDGVAANSNDFDLRVTTTTDTLEYDDLNADLLFGSLSATVGGTPTTGAAVFLRVSQFFSSTAAEPYVLYAVVQPPIATATPESEASGQSGLNETIATANLAANNYFTGALAGAAPSTDVDVFRFDATAGNVIFASLDGDPLRNNTPLNAKLTLMNSGGAVLIEVNDAGATSSTTSGAGTLTGTTPSSPAEALVYRVTTTGTYYVKVSTGTTSAVPTGAGDYLLSMTQGATGPTAVRFADYADSIRASHLDGGVLIEWRTAHEIDNLGFNVYREMNGRREPINSQLIAGSSLMFGAGVSLEAGCSYSWFDSAPVRSDVRYWIEDIGTDGHATLHGPVSVVEREGADRMTAMQAQSLTLGQLNSGESLSMPVEARVPLPETSATRLGTQSVIMDRPAIKLSVRSEGLYRVSVAELSAAGFDASASPNLLQLYADGLEQPIKLINDNEGRLAAIEFYGVGIDSPYTVTRAYWLTIGSQPGKRIEQVAGKGKRESASGFAYTVEKKDRTIYLSSLKNGDKENFFGAFVTGNPVEQVITLPNIDRTATDDTTLEVAMQGVTALPHRVQVEINGVRAGELVFNGQSGAVAVMRVAQSAIAEGQNIVRLTPMEGPTDVTLVNYIRISYNHRYSADAGALRFTAKGKQLVTVDGFTSDRVRVFDVTDASEVKEVSAVVTPQQNGYGVTIGVPGKGKRTLLAVAENQIKRPASITADITSSLRQSANEADLLIIARKDFFGALEPLKQLRQSQGLKVSLVDVEDVYDEFSFGQKTPQAIRDFLAYAKTSWKTAPRYALMVGDASYDPKNYLGRGDNDFVPTKLVETLLMETASDDWFSDFNSDGMADIATGRIPARSAQEVAMVVSKIVNYEIIQPSDAVLLVTDARDGFDYEASSAPLRSLIPGDSRVVEINRGVDAAEAKGRLIEAINRGQRVVNYMGHGSTDLWRGDLLTSSDASALANRGGASLFIMMTCLNGQFQDVARESLAETLVKIERGGAVAVWASSGMTEPQAQAVLNQEIFKLIFAADKAGAPSITLGEAMMRAKTAVSDRDVRRTWILFGDPSMRLK